MTFLRRVRRRQDEMFGTMRGRLEKVEPIVALIWIEAGSVALAFAADCYLLWPSRFAAMVDPLPEIAFVGLSLAAVSFTFALPHRPNRRFAFVACAILSIALLGHGPPFGIMPIVLSAVLAARLTFAFGFAGAMVAWGTACLTILVRVVAQANQLSLLSATPLLAYAVLSYAILLGLVFGIIAVMAAYAARSATAAATGERTRIALDLHDSIGHSLTTLAVQLEAARRYRIIDAGRADRYFELATTTTHELLSDVREIVGILYDHGAQKTEGLEIMIDRLLNGFRHTHDVNLVQTVELKVRPSGRTCIAIYRVLQECLTNITRHAAAKNVRVSVFTDERRAILHIEDDGNGFTREITDGHGFSFMRERIKALAGNITIESNPGAGTVVEAEIPLEGPA